MKSILFHMILPMLLLCGCSKLVRLEAPHTAGQVPVCFAMECSQSETSTRTLTDAQEKQIRDLNLYLFHKTNTGFIKHLYAASSTGRLTTELTPGDYDLYVIANAGRDCGTMTRAQAERYAQTITSERDLEQGGVLPLGVRQSVTIRGAATIPVQLIRAVARVDLKLSVAPAVASKITLRSAQLVSAPGSGLFFADNAPAQSSGLISYDRLPLSGSALTRSFYLYENLQGKVSTITSQTQRNRTKAPPRATYIHIEGESAGKKLDYYLYLGENTTDDFNVRRNKRYTLSAVVMGENTIDTRVSSAELQLTDVGTLYAPGEQLSTTLSLITQNNAGDPYQLKYHIWEGAGAVKIDGTSYAQDTPISLTAVNGTKALSISYTQAVAGSVRIGFTVIDRYGYALNRELTTTYKVRNPISGSLTSMLGVECHKSQYFTLSLSEVGYTGTFNVKCQLIQGTGTLYYNTTTQAVANGGNLSLAAGTHTFYYTGTQIGETVIRFTVTDTNGQTKVIDQRATMEPLTIYLRHKFTWGTQKVISGSQARMDSYIEIEIEIACQTPPRHTLTVTYKVGYNMTNTMNPPTTKSKPSQSYTCTLSPQSPTFQTRVVYNDSEGPKYYSDSYGTVNYDYILQHGYMISGLSLLSVDFPRPDDASVIYYCYSPQMVNLNR